MHRASGGSIDPGLSRKTIEHDILVQQTMAPLRGVYRIAVLSLKGGVGKTTTTVGLGSTFAARRGDRVIAVDANPDLGTLAQRVTQQTRSTVRDLLNDPSLHRYSDVRVHTSQSSSRLEVLASDRDPAAAEAFSEEDYRGVMRVLERYYSIVLTDCGTGLSHSAMRGIFTSAQRLILVTSPALDGARSADATLDWLHHHGYGALADSAVVVISSSRPGGGAQLDIQTLEKHFLARATAVEVIPFDEHLAEGAEVELDLMHKDTRDAFLRLAAVMAQDFSGDDGSAYGHAGNDMHTNRSSRGLP